MLSGVAGQLSLSNFFFQAEDGIRDVAVTGVQTCALPIFFNRRAFGPAIGEEIRRRERPVLWLVGHVLVQIPAARAREQGRRSAADEQEARSRSEERRVGKEGRSRWSPYS